MTKLLISLPELHIQRTKISSNGVRVTAHSPLATAGCPQGGAFSSKVQSYYGRKGKDLSISGRNTSLRLAVRRFRCINSDCPKRTFAERLSCLPVQA